ncbi:NAD(P)H-dependent oxidoreductase [Streptomyces sp. NPDC006872]|uniref:NADPH-dependent FMN reductase n=1 Tax=Streptomyces sp. NPDC006872 TaxID=3155720 RepID=UPI003407B1BF
MTRPQLTVVIASTRTGRFGPTVGHWFADIARKDETFDVDVLDLADVDLSPSFDAGPALARFSEQVGASDAFVIVTPEYNHSFPGPLKIALDSVRTEWQAKPVAFVSYGGLSGGLRAVEALRQVVAELHMVSVRASVSFHGAHTLFDADGQLLAPDAPLHAATELLGQLGWWTKTLKQGRTEEPYPA